MSACAGVFVDDPGGSDKLVERVLDPNTDYEDIDMSFEAYKAVYAALALRSGVPSVHLNRWLVRRTLDAPIYPDGDYFCPEQDTLALRHLLNFREYDAVRRMLTWQIVPPNQEGVVQRVSFGRGVLDMLARTLLVSSGPDLDRALDITEELLLHRDRAPSPGLRGRLRSLVGRALPLEDAVQQIVDELEDADDP